MHGRKGVVRPIDGPLGTVRIRRRNVQQPGRTSDQPVTGTECRRQRFVNNKRMAVRGKHSGACSEFVHCEAEPLRRR